MIRNYDDAIYVGGEGNGAHVLKSIVNHIGGVHGSFDFWIESGAVHFYCNCGKGGALVSVDWDETVWDADPRYIDPLDPDVRV